MCGGKVAVGLGKSCTMAEPIKISKCGRKYLDGRDDLSLRICSCLMDVSRKALLVAPILMNLMHGICLSPTAPKYALDIAWKQGFLPSTGAF